MALFWNTSGSSAFAWAAKLNCPSKSIALSDNNQVGFLHVLSPHICLELYQTPLCRSMSGELCGEGIGDDSEDLGNLAIGTNSTLKTLEILLLVRTASSAGAYAAIGHWWILLFESPLRKFSSS